MLHIYTSKDMVPKDRILVIDADGFFSRFDLIDDEFTRTVLREVEKSEYAYSDRFYDRFNRPLSKMALSTGSKALLSAHYASDMPYVISIAELGVRNVDLITKIVDGYVYVPYRIKLHGEAMMPIEVDGIVYESIPEADCAL